MSRTRPFSHATSKFSVSKSSAALTKKFPVCEKLPVPALFGEYPESEPIKKSSFHLPDAAAFLEDYPPSPEGTTDGRVASGHEIPEADSSEDEGYQAARRAAGSTTWDQFLLQTPLYIPHGKWAHDFENSFQDVIVLKHLSSGASADCSIKRGVLGGRAVTYISKLWDVGHDWEGFFSELMLYADSRYLRSLQGDCIPLIIGVHGIPGSSVGISMEPLNTTGWTEASHSMPRRLKIKVVEAYEKIHSQGVLHGDVETRHMLIGDDGKVCLIDFQMSRAIVPNEDVGLQACTPEELRLEMRKVKYKLDLDGAKKTERDRHLRSRKINQRGLSEPDEDPPLTADQLMSWEEEPGYEDVFNRFVMPGAADPFPSATNTRDFFKKLHKILTERLEDAAVLSCDDVGDGSDEDNGDSVEAGPPSIRRLTPSFDDVVGDYPTPESVRASSPKVDEYEPSKALQATLSMGFHSPKDTPSSITRRSLSIISTTPTHGDPLRLSSTSPPQFFSEFHSKKRLREPDNWDLSISPKRRK